MTSLATQKHSYRILYWLPGHDEGPWSGCAQREDGKRVFLKIGQKIDFLQEIQTLKTLTDSSLSSTKVLKLKDLLEIDGSILFTTAWISSTTFHTICRDRIPLCWEKLRIIIHDALSALLFLQQHNIIHGEISPRALLIQQDHYNDYRVVLGNFPPKKTDTTSSYDAPEIIAKEAPSFATDIFSLGVTLWEGVLYQPIFPIRWIPLEGHSYLAALQENVLNQQYPPYLRHKLPSLSYTYVPHSLEALLSPLLAKHRQLHLFCPLVLSMITLDPIRRPSVQSLLDSPLLHAGAQHVEGCHYIITKKLFQSCAHIYKVKNKEQKRFFLKLPSPKMPASFLEQEGSILRHLQNVADMTHIIQVIGFHSQTEDPALLLEWAGTWNMQDVIVNASHTITIAMIYDVAQQCIQALQQCAKNDLTHSDIKPENFLFYQYEEGHCHIKLCDFGLAFYGRKPLGLCTPGYESPEMLAKIPLDTRSDIFSLGATLGEFITTQPLFQTKDLTRLQKITYHEQALEKKYPLHMKPTPSEGTRLPPTHTTVHEKFFSPKIEQDAPALENSSVEQKQALYELVLQMLVIDPRFRSTLSQSLEHIEQHQPKHHRALGKEFH